MTFERRTASTRHHMVRHPAPRIYPRRYGTRVHHRKMVCPDLYDPVCPPSRSLGRLARPADLAFRLQQPQWQRPEKGHRCPSPKRRITTRTSLRALTKESIAGRKSRPTDGCSRGTSLSFRKCSTPFHTLSKSTRDDRNPNRPRSCHALAATYTKDIGSLPHPLHRPYQ